MGRQTAAMDNKPAMGQPWASQRPADQAPPLSLQDTGARALTRIYENSSHEKADGCADADPG